MIKLSQKIGANDGVGIKEIIRLKKKLLNVLKHGAILPLILLSDLTFTQTDVTEEQFEGRNLGDMHALKCLLN